MINNEKAKTFRTSVSINWNRGSVHPKISLVHRYLTCVQFGDRSKLLRRSDASLTVGVLRLVSISVYQKNDKRVHLRDEKLRLSPICQKCGKLLSLSVLKKSTAVISLTFYGNALWLTNFNCTCVSRDGSLEAAREDDVTYR
jgi:hypothetical protein